MAGTGAGVYGLLWEQNWDGGCGGVISGVVGGKWQCVIWLG